MCRSLRVNFLTHSSLRTIRNIFEAPGLTSRVQQAMELTTDLASRVKSNGITAAVVPRAYRDPIPLDWEQWKQTIAARYRGGTAQVLVDEMNASGLRVTYVLRRWLMLTAYLSKHKY